MPRGIKYNQKHVLYGQNGGFIHMFKLYFQVVYCGIQYTFMEKKLMGESKWATLYMSYIINITIMYI